MKIFFTFIFVLIFLGNSFAQKKEDSLKSVWFNKSLHDSIRLESMKSLIADHYLYSKTDSALILANRMLDYTHKKKYIKCEIDFQTIIGEIYFEQNKFDIGVESYTKGLDLAKTVKDSTVYSKKLFELGILYYNHEDYVNAFKTLQKSQEACRIVGDSLNEGWSVAYQGFIYKDLGDLKEAEGVVVTEHGLVSVSWKKAGDGSLDFSFEVPAGVKASVSVPKVSVAMSHL